MNRAAELSVEEQSISGVAPFEVDALLEKIGVVANSIIWKRVDNVVRVQGIVGKVNPYQNVVYFELKGGSTSLTVKAAAEQAPQEGDRLVVEGFPILRPSKFYTGLALQIDGRPVATWEPLNKGYSSSGRLTLNKSSYQTLYNCLMSTSFEQICIFGTETAIKDVLSNIPDGYKERFSTCVVRVSDPQSMLKDLAEVVDQFDAFAVVRGGNDASMEVWNQAEVVHELLSFSKPFYLALGHSHKMTLANQYADESFPTPTALGNYMKAHILAIAEHEQLHIRIDELTHKCADYKVKNAAILESVKGLKESITVERAKRHKLMLVAVAMLFVFSVYLYFSS